MEKPIVLLILAAATAALATVAGMLAVSGAASVRNAHVHGQLPLLVCMAAERPGSEIPYSVLEAAPRLVPTPRGCLIMGVSPPASPPGPCIRVNTSAVLVRAQCRETTLRRGEFVVVYGFPNGTIAVMPVRQ